ncbi:MAG: serine/threonine protein kinase [Acidiferrobacterales bacterium]
MTEPDSSQPPLHPYSALTPDVILDAVETYGYHCTGELLPLNSYENRVYRIGTSTEPLAVKFYRPDRWSDDAILEEHRFAQMLMAHEIPAVAPLADGNGRTLSIHDGFRFTLFPWQPGRVPELNRADEFEIVGRYLGRLHALGQTEDFAHRPTLTVTAFGNDAVDYIQRHDFIPMHLEQAYQTLTSQLLETIQARIASLPRLHNIRLHGDCHLGNLLWTETGPHIVDFDDCRMGPAVQDLWMLLSGEATEQETQLAYVLKGYLQFCEFDMSQLALIEPLRTLRMLHYSAWLAQRWDDPAFPMAFPWFNTTRYWEEQILSLREQQALLNEAPLRYQPELSG